MDRPTRPQIAQHLDLSLNRLNTLATRRVLHLDRPLDEIRVAYLRHLRVIAEERTGQPGDLSYERAKLAAKQREKLSMEIEAMRASLIPATDRGEIVRAIVEHGDRVLRLVPHDAALAIEGITDRDEIERRLRVEIIAAKARMDRALMNCADPEENGK